MGSLFISPMNHRLPMLASIALVLVLIGATCTGAGTPGTDDRPIYGDKQSPSSDTARTRDQAGASSSVEPGDIVLTVTKAGAGAVNMSWTVGDDTSFDENTRFILLRSTKDIEPIHDGLTYWWRVYHSRRDVTWEDLESGATYFRVCIAEDSDCQTYSNAVMLDVE